MKKFWELTKPWKWLLFSFLVFGFWLLGWSKKIFFGFSICKKPRRFIWGSIYSCTTDGFFRIFEKAVSELICTRLYLGSNNLFLNICKINFKQIHIWQSPCFKLNNYLIVNSVMIDNKFLFTNSRLDMLPIMLHKNNFQNWKRRDWNFPLACWP